MDDVIDDHVGVGVHEVDALLGNATRQVDAQLVLYKYEHLFEGK